MVRIHWKGIVQGVGYRYFIMRLAVRLNLKGWVRNNPDSSVEARVEGERENVGGLLQQSWNGPPGARVTGIYVEELDEPAQFRDFMITPK